MVSVRAMFGSNYNISIFILATESKGQIKWLQILVAPIEYSEASQ